MDTIMTREATCKLADAHGWDTEGSDGPMVYAVKSTGHRVTIYFPANDAWKGAPQRVLLSHRGINGDWVEPVELAEPDVRWALTEYGRNPAIGLGTA